MTISKVDFSIFDENTQDSIELSEAIADDRDFKDWDSVANQKGLPDVYIEEAL